MTEQEAIKVLEEKGKHIEMIKIDGKDTLCYRAILVEAFEVAHKALEKQIAKKPLIQYHCGLEKRCPTCNCEVSDIEHRKWSCKCGQVLDWE